MHRGVNRAEATRRTSRRIVKQAASAGARAPRKSVASAAAMDILKPMVNQKIGLGTEDALDGTFRALADPARRAILARRTIGLAACLRHRAGRRGERFIRDMRCQLRR